MEVHFFHEDVGEFVRHLSIPAHAKTLRTIELLRNHGHLLRMPHSKQVSPNIFELRIHDAEEVRLFYTFYDQKAVILHGYIKKAEKMSERAWKIAQQRKRCLMAHNIYVI